MTITINHPNHGGFLNKNRLAVAAAAAAALVSLGLYTQVGSTDSVRSVTTDPVVERIDRQAETDHFVSLNEIPWSPAPAVDEQAQLAAELDAIRAGGERAPAAPAATTDAERAFFLSINDAEEPSAQSASSADPDRAFFLSINDVEG